MSQDDPRLLPSGAIVSPQGYWYWVGGLTPWKAVAPKPPEKKPTAWHQLNRGNQLVKQTKTWREAGPAYAELVAALGSPEAALAKIIDLATASSAAASAPPAAQSAPATSPPAASPARAANMPALPPAQANIAPAAQPAPASSETAAPIPASYYSAPHSASPSARPTSTAKSYGLPKWLLVLGFILFLPVTGVVWIWRRAWTPRTKWVLTAGWAIFWVIAIVASNASATAPQWPGVTGSVQSPKPPVAAAPASPSPAELPSPSPKPVVVAVAPSPSLKPAPPPAAAPPPPPPPPPPPAVNYCGAPSNPWGYNFCSANSGRYITNPNADFCSVFNCIKSFWQHTNGYVDECNDGTYSHSGGVSGACSYHGGEMRPLWA